MSCSVKVTLSLSIFLWTELFCQYEIALLFFTVARPFVFTERDTLYLDWLIDGSKLAPQILWMGFMVRITQFTSYCSIRRRGYNVEWYTIAFQVAVYIAICFAFYFNALENMSLEIISLHSRLKFQYAADI